MSMLHKEDTVWPLRTYQDSILGYTFVDCLGTKSRYSIKLPTTLEKYKLGHFITPVYLLDIDLIKTRKNWVVTVINRQEILVPLKNYQDHAALAECVRLVIALTQSDEETDLLAHIQEFFMGSGPIDIALFEKMVLENQGFLEKKLPYTSRKVAIAKRMNDIRTETNNALL